MSAPHPPLGTYSAVWMREACLGLGRPGLLISNTLLYLPNPLLKGSFLWKGELEVCGYLLSGHKV